MISSMTVTYDSVNLDVDLIDALGTPLSITMLDIAGVEMTTAGQANVCPDNLPLAPVWSMISSDATLN